MEVLSSKNATAVLKKAIRQLAGLEQPTLEAEVLLAYVLGSTRSRLLNLAERKLSEDQLMQFNQLLERRLQGEPAAYLTGYREFWSLDLQVTPDVLIPRPETERLVELALERIPENECWRIADLGTGSGAIALAIARERPCCRIIATDISEAALEVANANAERLAIRNIEFRLGGGDWFGVLQDEQFDMVVSNPPYVRSDDPHLEALRFEPQIALVAGADGLQSLRDVATQARRHFTFLSLTPPASPPSLRSPRRERVAKPGEGGGWLLLEHGYDQGSELLQMLAGLGYESALDYTDLAGLPRIAVAQWKISNE
ncbi:MAG: peptide chain release factor N(5)-glutamine methyltransferase [Gammaproteobacteria bacterium]|nr:peptide chain release factor N(5)-glutamine methyltransferase [Gammaproteobacteria bacterium]